MNFPSPRFRRHASVSGGKLTPLAQALAALLMAGGLSLPGTAQARAWFAAEGAGKNAASGAAARAPAGRAGLGASGSAAQQAAARQKLTRSIENLNRTAGAIAAAQAAQAAARQAAQAASPVPDGLAEGGLKLAAGAADDALAPSSVRDPALWQNARLPVQSRANGHTTVHVEQTADRAILNWETFNVGRDTTVQFQQDSNWAVLNRVVDPAARPSQILGRIKGDGTVLVVNRNGIVFGGASQVDARNLVAAAASITDTQFRGHGLYGADAGTPSFTDAAGRIEVQAGARISTSVPTSVTQGGGYVLLLGTEVSNAGTISTQKGQALLAAGDDFILRKGMGTEGNTHATTRGSEIAVLRDPDGLDAGGNAVPNPSGTVVNTGLILAREGDVTLAGHDVRQQGVAVATTTVNTRGTIHLLNSQGDAAGRVALGAGATTAVVIEDDGQTALDSQRSALLGESVAQDKLRVLSTPGAFDNYSRLGDRRDQSRIEIVSGGDVAFEGGSLTLATGGQVVADAKGRSVLADRAQVDVSGAVGVRVAMESNSIQVNVQGNELRDAPVNRDTGRLVNNDVWVDRRRLVLLPAGTGGYASDRWYTAGGLLEVGGYLGNQGHTAGEWAAQGGSVTLAGGQVVTQPGSMVNLAGGTLDVQTGYVRQSWLRGAAGALYSLDSASADIAYRGFYKGYEAASPRWGVTAYYRSPLIGPSQWREPGYTVGRDAGTLIVSAPAALLDGDIDAAVYNGPRQFQARPADLQDGYLLGQTQVAQAAGLVVGHASGAGFEPPYDSRIVVGGEQGEPQAGTLWLDAARLSRMGLGRLDLASAAGIAVTQDLTLAEGGRLQLVAPDVDIAATVTAHGGTVEATNVFDQDQRWGTPDTLLDADGGARIRLREGAVLDLRGLRADAAQDAASANRRGWIDGGEARLAATGDVALAAGSRIDVSSGAAILDDGKVQGGKGGDVTIAANVYAAGAGAPAGRLTLDGTLLGHGVAGGGRLSVGGAPVLIAEDGAALQAGQVLLRPGVFRSGFAHYEIAGGAVPTSIAVAAGTVVDVEMPVYRLADAGQAAPAGAGGFEAWTPPLYQVDPAGAAFVQRKGASLSFVNAAEVSIGTGSRIEVDPGQSIAISASGQVTIDGRLDAWGGTIAINSGLGFGQPGDPMPGRSIWIGGNAVLDVAGRAVSGRDEPGGRPFAHVQDGGTIRIGTGALTLDDATLPASVTPLLVIVRPGAVLDASAASAAVDLDAGTANPSARSGVRTLAGNGGTITLASSTGLALDGEMRAAGGGAGAADGALNLILETRFYGDDVPDAVKAPRILSISQGRRPSSLPAGLAPGEDHAALGYAQGWISAEQVRAGGFGNLSLWSADVIRFEGDVSLQLNQSLALRRGVIAVADATPGAHVSLSAPVVRLDGSVARGTSGLEGLHPGLRNVKAGAWQPAATANAATLAVEADLIDIGNWVAFGVTDSYDIAFLTEWSFETITRPFEAPGFADIRLSSRGDIRLRGGSIGTAGNMTLTASRIYPATGASTTIFAGAVGAGSGSIQPRPDSVLAIRGNGRDAGAPASIFGSIGLLAGVIDQGGALYAPLGTIRLGANAGGAGFQEYRNGGQVVLRDGSTTSVSAAGLVIPYGGTVDGLKYHYNGQELALPDLMALGAMGKVEIASDRFEAEPGAVLDLSGGGELAGAGFVAGRGGSVDILGAPLAAANPSFGFSAAGNRIYAIVPGHAADYAPLMQEKGAGDPAVGQQISVPAGIPGLAAGTYTLLPSNFALLPGAFRVEIGAGLRRDPGVIAMRNGSYAAGGYLGIANTAIGAVLPNQIVVTPAQAVRTHSQYNETSYSRFALEQAARFGTTRARLPSDGKQLVLTFEEAGEVLDFRGIARFGPGEGGYAGSLLVQAYEDVEIKAAGSAATADMVSLDAEDLSRFATGTLFVGGAYDYGSGGNVYLRSGLFTDADVAVRKGAVLEAGQILLASNNILVEDGAVLDTTRSTFAVPDSTLGYIFANGNGPDDTQFGTVLVVANGWLNLLPAVVPRNSVSSRLVVADGAVLRTRGTIGFVAADQLSLGQAQLNARYLALSLPAVNVGTESSLAAAQAAGVLGTGWNLTQTTLDRLLNPATTNLAALERLSFSARDGIRFYGDVSLDARNRAGGSYETMVVLNTPAIYGWGGADASAVLAADTLVWNGIATGTGTVADPYASLQPPAVQPGGAGTGSGRLAFQAREIHFGYDPLARSQNSADVERLSLGFSGVELVATEKVTANNRGRVSFYRSGTDAASYAGGDLTIATPLLTADSGAMIDIRAGGAIAVNAAGTAADPSTQADLGGEIRLQGGSVLLDTTVALPSGRLVMAAQGDIALGDRARVDLAGRAVSFFDVTKHSWGGSLELESHGGRIAQAAGSVIDVSARDNDAGTIEAVATQGSAVFSGTLRGSADGGGNAGGFALSADAIADFAGLNTLLNDGGFFGERRFTARRGDLVVGDGVRARSVTISADGGSLIVNGRIDASGEKAGSIRLSARDDLTLAAGAALDAHGAVLQVDSHGAAIDASNRGSVELTASRGVVAFAQGATIDMRSADGIARGRLEINAPRVGSDGIGIDAAARVDILGAASIAVNGFRGYTPAGGIINQAYLDGIHGDSAAFIAAAGANGALQARLAGLRAHGPAFHLRPGVEIASAGDLATQGDLDLSGYRYGPGADPGVRGSGEPGVLVVRAGGDIKINGSVNDGFAPPPATPDDYNWDDGRAGRMWAVAPMLAPGSRSWSMRWVSGADLAASDTRGVRSLQALGEHGDLVLEDRHIGGGWMLEAMSVVRTGTGYLDMIAGRDYRHASLFGVYTAGAALPETQAYSGLWLTGGGGDVRVEAGRDMAGYVYTSDLNTDQRRINEWLRWQDGAWGINFGAYIADTWGMEELAGFSGIGALGGGNVTVTAGGDAGVTQPQILEINPDIGLFEARTGGLTVAVGGSGYVDAGGVLRQTGGGDIVMRIGGRLNKAPLANPNNPGGSTLINVRGDVSVTASTIGLVSNLGYGSPLGYPDPRPIDPTRPYDYRPDSGLTLALGDSRATINTRGDLVILHASDPGATDPASLGAIYLPSISAPGFSLWTERTAIDLFSAGGSVAPVSTYAINSGAFNDGYYGYVGKRPYPPALGVVAAGGNVLVFGRAELMPTPGSRLDLLARDSIYFGYNPSGEGNYLTIWDEDIANTASRPMRFYAVGGDLTNVRTGYIRQPTGEFLETAYIGGGPVWMRAGRDIIAAGGVDDRSSDWLDEGGIGGLIVHSGDNDISIVQAGRDIIYANLKIGGPGTLEVTASGDIYQADRGSIVALGPVAEGDTRPGASIAIQAGAGAAGADWAALAALYLDPANQADLTPGHPLADQPGKVARVYGGELTLAGWLRQEFGYGGDEAGAPAWLAARQAELNARRAADGKSLRDLNREYADASQAYLVNWLRARFAQQYDGMDDARAFFAALPAEQQRAYLRNVYYAELKAGGREYNDPASSRYGSYLRGRQMIATLFPVYETGGDLAAQVQSGLDPQGSDAAGQPYAQKYAAIARGGDFTMFSSATGTPGTPSYKTIDSSLRTQFGGDVSVLAPAGQIVAGVQGVVPGSMSGIVTQGEGDVSLYSRGSILLGLSRIMTTFGGGILAWSAEGDINAGRGAKTTVIYTPPRRVYDQWGNAALSPQAPSSGAGIATLAPIPEVPPGDVDLIAPLGTIDAGEAGIRVSGNVNVAALQVLNAANIQVQGESKGVPVAAVVNTGALTSASAAATSAATAAQDAVSRSRAAVRQGLPSIISVQVLGFGNEPAAPPPGGRDGGAGGSSSYNPRNAVRVLGLGELPEGARRQLTSPERANLGL
ncbi:Heme:hemopexin utilization protein A [Bordetella ansorpii]|uniref:Heme:hemopexin utilization protein A n=1 Tax=Bordetella ansorpii TaxID=288768 RepID=A0A157LEU3_9BORD|nr:filamentous haemagglutinin family protein [Bordetella ansorpii]SAH95237.1 Heme:hemopexin utilization protein A [Bordetella ansorpii]